MAPGLDDGEAAGDEASVGEGRVCSRVAAGAVEVRERRRLVHVDAIRWVARESDAGVEGGRLGGSEHGFLGRVHAEGERTPRLRPWLGHARGLCSVALVWMRNTIGPKCSRPAAPSDLLPSERVPGLGADFGLGEYGAWRA